MSPYELSLHNAELYISPAPGIGGLLRCGALFSALCTLSRLCAALQLNSEERCPAGWLQTCAEINAPRVGLAADDAPLPHGHHWKTHDTTLQ